MGSSPTRVASSCIQALLFLNKNLKHFSDSAVPNQARKKTRNNFCNKSLWRNRLARSAVNREDGGSSPPRDVMMEASIFTTSLSRRLVAMESTHTWGCGKLPSCGHCNAISGSTDILNMPGSFQWGL